LGANPENIASQITAIELFSEEASKARKALSALTKHHTRDAIHTGDFFAWLQPKTTGQYTVAVGNPPFVRYQSIPEPSRSLAMGLMEEAGLKPNKLTNFWVPFVVGVTRVLAPGGRLGLVIPAEILQVFYAAQLRAYLMDMFESIQVYTCNDLVFQDAEQEVVVLLASGKRSASGGGHHCRINVVQRKSQAELVSESAPLQADSRESKKVVSRDSEKWLKYLLSSREIDFMRELRGKNPAVTRLSSHASVDVGIVTGKNEFFVLSRSQVATLGLHEYVRPIVSKAIQLEGAVLTKKDMQALCKSDQRVFLLYLNDLPRVSLSSSLLSYISAGEKSGVHSGYKCSIRKPWYTVPDGWEPSCFLFRQIHGFPRIVINEAEATATDTIHRLTCRGEANAIVPQLYNHLFAASAEIQGRSYGGGVLELEPSEAESLLVPKAIGSALPISEVDKLIRMGNLNAVLEQHDRMILRENLGLTVSECRLLSEIWKKMRDRRHARRSKASPMRA
jgi:adenine-specific DNA methylase